MQYMGDQNYWNEKFKQRGQTLMAPEALLMADAKAYHFLKQGLELACGDGRNSMALAEQGYEMTGVDFSQAALKRLENFTQAKNIKIKTLQADLTEATFLESLAQYDFIVINHYRLAPAFYKALMGHLNTGGYLWVNGFNKVPLEQMAITEKELIQAEDFKEIQANSIDVKPYTIGKRQFTRYLFKK